MRIAVIGGGIYGASVAYFLEHFGAEDVHLFERGEITEGSTGKSAAIVRQHYSNESHLRIAKRGRDILAELEEYVGQDGGFVQNGYLLLAGNESESALRDNVAIQESLGIDVEVLSPERISEQVPMLNVDDVAVGALENGSGFADPKEVTRAFIKKARELGTDVHDNTAVTGLDLNDSNSIRIETERGTLRSDYVVNAAGPWGGKVAEMVGIDVPINWHESRLAELDSSPPFGPDFPTVSDVDLGLYAKPETNGHFIAGGADRNEEENRSVNTDTGLNGVDAEFISNLHDLINHRFSGLSDVRTTGTWSGIVTVTPDWHQIIGVPDGCENFYNVLGPSGHGFKEAPGFAESIAQDIVGEEPRNDLSPYRLERFGSDNTFVSRYGEGSRA